MIENQNKLLLKNIIKTLLSNFLVFLVLFISSGRLNWVEAWIFIFLWAFFQIIQQLILFVFNPELLGKRNVNTPDIKKWDIVFQRIYLPFVFILIIVAGIDGGRFSKYMSMHKQLFIFGSITMTLGYLLSIWSIYINTHFETSVRIQQDRKHKVITSGPYRVVRHPGYTAAIVIFLSIPLILKSTWAFIPAFIILILFIIRTYLEDNTLKNELASYAEFCVKTKYRLFPYIW